MRILLVSSGSGSRGGGEIFLDYLGTGLADRGHEVIVWIPRHSRMDELASRCAQFSRVVRAEYRNTYDRRARSLPTAFNWLASRRIAQEWAKLAPDVIHVNKQNLEDGFDLLRAARLAGLPSICTVHITQTATYLRAKAAPLRDVFARWQLAKYKGMLVAVQDKRREELQQFLGDHSRTATVFNGVPIPDDEALRSLRATKRTELGLSDGDFLVVGVGRLVRQKRPLEFLRMAEILNARLPNTKFVWVGDGDLAGPWRDTIARNRLSEIVSCVGWQADVQPFLAAGDLLLHVAEFEGLPFVVIEAMAAKLACSIGRELSLEVPLFTEDNVLFNDNVEVLANNIQAGLWAKVAQGGAKLARTELSIDSMIGRYERLYETERSMQAGRADCRA